MRRGLYGTPAARSLWLGSEPTTTISLLKRHRPRCGRFRPLVRSAVSELHRDRAGFSVFLRGSPGPGLPVASLLSFGSAAVRDGEFPGASDSWRPTGRRLRLAVPWQDRLGHHPGVRAEAAAPATIHSEPTIRPRPHVRERSPADQQWTEPAPV